jgi:hypothetical protein
MPSVRRSQIIGRLSDAAGSLHIARLPDVQPAEKVISQRMNVPVDDTIQLPPYLINIRLFGGGGIIEQSLQLFHDSGYVRLIAYQDTQHSWLLVLSSRRT